VVSVFLGRTIGAEGLGIINLSNRIIPLSLLFCLLGVRTVLVKNVAIGYNLKEWHRIGAFMHTAYIFNGILSVIIVSILLLLTPWLTETIFNEPRLTIPLMIAIVSMVPQTFSRIFSAGVNGFRKIWQSNLVDQTLSTAIVVIILVIFYLSNNEITVVRVAISYAIGRLLVAVAMGVYWKKLFTYKKKPNLILKELLKPAMPLLWISISSIIAANADAIMLGWLSDTKQVGLYTVAARIALLTSFFLQVTNSVISPKLAGLFAEGKKNEIQKMVQQTTKGLSLIAGIPLILFILFGKSILGLWGEEFVFAYPILVILSIGQFFNISTGCSGLLMVMCGHEKYQGYISFIFVILNLTLNYILISNYEAIGAAMASAITVTGENISKVIIAKKKVGVLTIPMRF
jgi:O-antigen/teichoic acid export membrane protein